MEKEWKAWLHRHRRVVLAAVIITMLILLSFGAKIALYLNFLLGNDIVVKLNADKENVTLAHGESEAVRFEAAVTTNPFCSATCTSRFEDMSYGTVIDNSTFTLKPGRPLQKEFALSAEQPGTGQQIYRFTMECMSVPGVLCHTNGELTRRSILVTAAYGLNAAEEEVKEEASQLLPEAAERLAALESLRDALHATAAAISKTMPASTENLTAAALRINEHGDELQRLAKEWEMQRYTGLGAAVTALHAAMAQTEQQLQLINDSFLAILTRHNAAIARLNETRRQLGELTAAMLLDSSIAEGVNSSIAIFNNAADTAAGKTPLKEKEAAAENATAAAYASEELIRKHHRNETMRLELLHDTTADAMCSITGACIAHPNISERAVQEAFDIAAACSTVEDIRRTVLAVNESLQKEFVNEGYPENATFWQNVTMMVVNLKMSTSNSYLKWLPRQASNAALIQRLLAQDKQQGTYIDDSYNLTPALVAGIAGHLPEACMPVSGNFAAIAAVEAQPLQAAELQYRGSNFMLHEPEPQCCAFGQCTSCCSSDECANNAALAPVVFLHGHAPSEDASAEYSLDAFNQIQEQLEKDGYLNAGAISLYTEQGTPPGSWGKARVPVTIKASYYFDLFETPENYVVVQTKSENIDTYAVRLKELLDTITYKTGRSNAVIVAHSMGGLVARRYLQVFGSEKVEKLIMIGTPNKGIEGRIADFCPLLGQKLECRDMQAGSLFLNKLNREQAPETPPLVNIIGTGCNMPGGKGDGIVLEGNVLLAGAKNVVITGNCSAGTTLHTELLDINKYPEVYAVIREELGAPQTR